MAVVDNSETSVFSESWFWLGSGRGQGDCRWFILLQMFKKGKAWGRATKAFCEDITQASGALSSCNSYWEGKAAILELKDADYNWRQMEWWAFYFEYKAMCLRNVGFSMPGEKFNSVVFDATRNVNWDLKAKAVKSDNHLAILNDVRAMNESARQRGEHGVMLALCDVEYNDEHRTFQRWHTELKGGASKYERERQARTSLSRYRKTNARMSEILFLRFTVDDLSVLPQMRQGRNSNGRPRPPKYMLDLEESVELIAGRLIFP